MKLLFGRETMHPGARDARGRLGIVIAVNLGVAPALVLLARLARSGGLSSSLAWSLVVPLVFADCVWTLASLIVPRAAQIITRRGFHQRWILLVLFAVTVGGCLLAAWILTALGIFGGARYRPLFYSSIGVALVIGLLIGAGEYVRQGLKKRLQSMALELRARELEEERARKLAAEARLSSLESRIHPHFLFNTLNSISSLVREDPSAAERLIQALSSLLRFSLDSQHHVVPLGKELKIVADYLVIEKARFGNRLRYAIAVPEALESTPVPPLSVQTIVENSLKYGLSNRKEGGYLGVTARSSGDLVSIEVIDDGPGFNADCIPPGHGLDNLQARLVQLYADAGIHVTRTDGQTIVGFTVPQAELGALAC